MANVAAVSLRVLSLPARTDGERFLREEAFGAALLFTPLFAALLLWDASRWIAWVLHER